MSLKRLIVVALAAGALFSGAASAALPPGYKIQLLTDNYPPFNMAEDGKNFAREQNIHGFAADVLRETFKRAGIAYEMTLRFPWARVYQAALDNPNHGVFVTTRVPEREKLFKWVGPLGTHAWEVLAKAESPISFSSLEEARQYRFGTYKSNIISDQLRAKGLTVAETLRDQENVHKLQNGQIDLWATGDPSGRYLAKQEGVTGLKTVFRVEYGQLFLALNLQTPDEAVQRLQSALDQLRAEGFLDKTMSRYLE